MAIVSSGASVEYDIPINTRFEVSTLGEAYVDALSGPIATGGESVRVMPGREYRRGPYTVPCRVRVRCISGSAVYGPAVERQPVFSEAGPGGGNRLFAGGDVISTYQDALRFAFPMQFESGGSPARDSSGRGTQLLVGDSAPWDTGWLKGAASQSRRISADSMGLDLARDSFVFSFLYKATAGLTTAICGTNSFGAFSETMGYGFFMNNNSDKVAARIRCAEGSTLSFNGLATVQDGVEHVIQMTWDSSQAKGTLYVDGVEDASGVAVEVDAAATVTVPLQLSGSGGAGNPAHRFAGVQLFVFEGTGLPSSADDLLIKLSSRPREIPVNFL